MPFFTCDDWTNADPLKAVLSGLPNYGGQSWISSTYPGCADPVSLYCFGVDRYVPIVVPPPPPGSRRLFLTYAPTLGNESASGHCYAEANLYGLANPSNFVAYQVGTEHPSQKLNLDGGDWYRLDGIKVLTAREVNRPDGGPFVFLAPPNVAPGGEQLSSPVWIGDLFTQPGAGQPLTCANWSTTAGQAWVIDSTAEVPAFGQRNCAEGARAICVEP